MDKYNSVEVVIPIYKTNLSDLELKALQQAYNILSKYSLTVIKPQTLDLSELLSHFPLLKTKSFEDSFFSSIKGYNKLMLSKDFYAAFLQNKYILIYQLDAFVFRDELASWCAKDYDYIGAPWLKKPIYNLPLISTVMSLSRLYDRWRKVKNKQELYNKVGNGGLSLRKVQSHYEILIKEEERVNSFLQQSGHLYNEDVFWATTDSFTYPDPIEALAFAFDKYPALCYKLNGRKLPFGCHAWYKKKMKSFWKPIIGF